MGEPNVAMPCCGRVNREQLPEQVGRKLTTLPVLARSTLVVAFLMALFGGAVLVAQYADVARGVASQLAAVGLGGGIGLVSSGIALGVAALLLERSADCLAQAKQASCNPEISIADLQRNEQRYHMLVQLMSTFCGTGDASGGIDSFQEGWQQYTGQSWDEQRGYGWIDAIHPDDRQRILHLWGETVRLKCSTRVEYRLWHAASQEYRFCESAALPLFNGDGTVREWISAVRDIDEEVGRVANTIQTESQHRRSTPTYASSPDACFAGVGGPRGEQLSAERAASPCVLDREQN